MQYENHVDEYLKRIEISHPTNGPTKEYLNQLHLAHLTHIPFETFDLIDVKQLDISPDHTFHRLVRERRGGVCYHMNGLLAFILKNLNYNIQLIPCSVYNSDINNYFDEYSHLSLCVTLDDGTKLLCDVGFSEDYLTPLFFRTDCIQYATNGFFRLTKTEDESHYKLERGFLKDKEKIDLPTSSSPQTHIIDINPERIKWTILYRFPISFPEKTTKLEDFQSLLSFVLYSPSTILNRYTICHIHTYKPFIGAYGIIGKEYWEWKIENGIKTRKHFPISDDDEFKKILKEKFNLTIDRKIQLVDGST